MVSGQLGRVEAGASTGHLRGQALGQSRCQTSSSPSSFIFIPDGSAGGLGPDTASLCLSLSEPLCQVANEL